MQVPTESATDPLPGFGRDVNAEQCPALLGLERERWSAGCARVAGVDEVGRGPLAGPVLACAVVFLCESAIPAGLADSKRLTAARREVLAARLHACSRVELGLGIVAPGDIDRLNILRATHVAMKRALEDLPSPPDFILVDGRPVPGLPVPSRALVGGDGRSASIAAASIVAKVRRDALMVGLASAYPGYGFDAHKGYGTRQHLAALDRLGPCPIHRRSFAPVRARLPGVPRQTTLDI